MKYRIFLATVLFIVAGIVFYIGAQLSKGENFLSKVAKPADVVVDSLSIAGVSQLVSEGICDIEIFNSDREMMVVSYDATAVTNHSTVEEKKLIIHLGVDKIGFFDFTMRPDIKVEIYTQHLDSLVNSGTGHITSRDTFEMESLYIQNEGIGSIEYTAKAKNIVAKNRGVGSIDLYGNTDQLYAINEGIGSINTNKLIALNVKARNSGVGSMELYAGDSLALSNDGIGSIRYSGPGVVYSERNEGIGSIKRD
ncbi:MAG: hypothetical protein ACJAR8_000680 [Bacteroidia bacterium]|jgi:hypothetical protein